MSKQPKLDDLPLVLLSHAAKTDESTLFPLPASIDADAARTEAKTLLRRGFLSELETSVAASSWRSDGDLHFGLIITDSGKAAIGLDEPDPNETDEATAATPSTALADNRTKPNEGKPRDNSKIANVLALLRRSEGVTLAGLVEATGWQQHTVRAAMTGLRKRGFDVQRRKDGDASIWFITEAGE